MFKLYGYPHSRSMRVAWALEEVGARYDYEKVDFGTHAHRAPKFLALNPGGKVPVLTDGDLVLTESAAIIIHVGDRHPNSGIVPPAGSRERALMNKWCFFSMSELEQPLWTINKHRVNLPEALRVPAVIDTARHEFAVVAEVLENAFGSGPYLLGERFTVADILVSATLGWARSLSLPYADKLESYRRLCTGRPALKAAIAREQAG